MSETTPRPLERVRAPIAPTEAGLAHLIHAYGPELYPDLTVLERMSLDALWVIAQGLDIDHPERTGNPILHPYPRG